MLSYGSERRVVQHAPEIPADKVVTAVAAVNSPVVLTLPAPPSGYHLYITRIVVEKLYSVVGIPSAAGVVITSTNLPGSLAWTTEQAAGAAGTVVCVVGETYIHPLKSLVKELSVALTAPAQLETIWRMTAYYYEAG